MRETAAKFAPDMPLRTIDGQAVRMSEIWREGTTAFTFIRYLSCIFCKEQVRSYQPAGTELERAGLRVVIVSPASVEDTALFASSLDLPFPVYCDPDQSAYAAYGFEKGSIGQMINPRIVARGVQATLRGNFLAPPKGGDPRQLPGTAIVAPDGRLVHHHIARDASDYLSLDELLDVARRLDVEAAV